MKYMVFMNAIKELNIIRKTLRKATLFACLALLSASALAQQKADLGIRVNTADLNRLQLEFRKPIGEKYTLRLAGSYGQNTQYPWTTVSDANDSVVTSRISMQTNLSSDLRFGLERRLKWNYLSLHADLVTGYYRLAKQSWNSYSVLDSNNNWSDPYFTPGYGGLDAQFSNAGDHFITLGLVLGISADYPLSDRLILNLNANYGLMSRFQVAHSEYNDFANEYYDGNTTIQELYPSAGIGLRYQLGKKQVQE